MPLTVRLDDLIRHVRDEHPEGGPLDHLSVAVAAAGQLTDLADHLIGHFVDRARHAGASWSAIGEAMGVTKQAAQQRSVPRFPTGDELEAQGRFGRFTVRARAVVTHAQGEARSHGHAMVETGHIVLGLLADPKSLAARAIKAQGVKLAVARKAALATLGPTVGAVPDHIPFALDSKRALALTLREALRLGHNYVGTEHILLGLLSDATMPGSRLLLDAGVDPARAEDWVTAQLTEHIGNTS
ncbi:MAG TPA: Clp protease N-terminal domain-containing protein [Ilumatobacteraceae bacterium]|nr:Clp protease N-terminal domain-containing protein [Ilumatobacteraceae bacterium]